MKSFKFFTLIFLLLLFCIFYLNLVEIRSQITLQQLWMKDINWLPLTADMSLRPVFVPSSSSSANVATATAIELFGYSVDYTAYALNNKSRSRTPLAKLVFYIPSAQLSNTFQYFTPIFFRIVFCIILQAFIEIR